MDTQTLVITRNGTDETVDHTHLLEWTLIALADGPVVDFAGYADWVAVEVDGEQVLVELELVAGEGEPGEELPSQLTAWDADDMIVAEWEV